MLSSNHLPNTRIAQFALFVLLYLEQVGLVPERFSSAAQASWQGVMPFSRPVDLFEMAVRDGVRANPHLFAPFRSQTARHELRALSRDAWEEPLERLRSRNLRPLSPEELYREGAEILGIELPLADLTALQELPSEAVDRSSLIAELPNGCGYPSLLLCQRYNVLDPAHNLRIFVDGMEAEMLAAWAMVLLTGQFTLPPGRIVAVSAEKREPLAQEAFDIALVYRPVSWLLPDLSQLVSAKAVVRL